MGKLKMGNNNTTKTSRVIVKPISEPEIVEVEKIVEVPVEKVIEKVVEKEVPVYMDSDTKMGLKNVLKKVSAVSVENQVNKSEIEEAEKRLKEKIDNLGQSAAESLDVAFKQLQQASQVVNRQGAVIVALRADIERKERKRKTLIKRLVKERKNKRESDKKVNIFCTGLLILNIITLCVVLFS